MPEPQQPTPDHIGYSLANMAEIVFPCLDAAGVGSVVEIGAYHGHLTTDLLDWAEGAGASVAAVDPTPPAPLVDLARRRPELELIRETSHEALAHIPLPDALIIDGDHNYYTLSEELRLVDSRAGEGAMPLLLFHDVAWPHARRDTYYDPQRIPEEHRQPLCHDVAIAPGEPGIAEGGLRYEWAAAREGGPRNGVLTAIEDFLSGRDRLRLVVVPAFFGVGVVWDRDASWAGAVAEIVERWDRDPMIARMEANRVSHLIERNRLFEELQAVNRLRSEEVERLARQEGLLRTMLASSAFAWGERLSRLRQRGRPMFSREQVREALGEPTRHPAE